MIDQTTDTTPSVTFHEVLAGETFYQIAKKYGVTVEELAKWNNRPDFQIKVGEKIVITEP